jgi:exonuclease III
MKYCSVVLMILFWAGTSCNDSDDESGEGKAFSSCVPSFRQNENFEVVTFNLEDFPKQNNTIMNTSGLLTRLNADVIAIQEITNEGALKELAAQMDGWEYVFTPSPSNNISLGFLVKMTEIELVEEETQVLFDDDSYLFPRAPLVIKVRDRESDFETWLINIHLKAFDGAEDIKRRLLAAQKLKEYLDSNLADEFVILLGDYNDELAEEIASDDVFSSFTQDSENYMFADMTITTGDDDFWSYPDYPSHIDHILITDEWFDYFDSAMTIRADECFSSYEKYISDHRPVVAVFDLD